MNNKGISLIETVIAIVIVSIAVTGILTVFYNNSIKGTKPALELKAIELGQGLMDEIMFKRWDENTPLGGGAIPLSLANIGREGETKREDFDDLDDYDGYSDGTSSEPLKDSRGVELTGFTGFSRSVSIAFVKPTGASGSINVNNYKQITITVTIPTGESFVFKGTKTNI